MARSLVEGLPQLQCTLLVVLLRLLPCTPARARRSSRLPGSDQLKHEAISQCKHDSVFRGAPAEDTFGSFELSITVGNPPVTFVIFSNPRSGSGLLVDLLNRHPAIRCAGEAFTPFESQVGSLLPGWNLKTRDANRSGYLAELFDGGGAKSAVGFKAFLWHFSPSELEALATSPHVKKLWLRRANMLDMYVSQRKAWKKGAFYGANTTALKVWLPLPNFYDYVAKLDQEAACLDHFQDESWLKVDYDAMVSDMAAGTPNGGTITEMYKFLGLSPIPPRNIASQLSSPVQTSRSNTTYGSSNGLAVKQDNSKFHSQSITNYAMVARAFHGTRFDAMLKKPPV